jgi:uncharacterized membrane protein
MIRERILDMRLTQDAGFRWRSREVSRVEGLSDAVFGFAVTLLVVSLEVPKTFADLRASMNGFLAFAASFAVLVMIWRQQYVYFRRYGLETNTSFTLNIVLLFVVLFYVYPLKFLFRTFLHLLMGGANEVVVDGAAVPMLGNADWRELIMIYSTGYAAIFLIFALLYLHAYRHREALELTPLERAETKFSIIEQLVMVAIGLVSVLLAFMGMPGWGGMIYFAIGPALTLTGHLLGERKKAIRRAASGEPATEGAIAAAP